MYDGVVGSTYPNSYPVFSDVVAGYVVASAKFEHKPRIPILRNIVVRNSSVIGYGQVQSIPCVFCYVVVTNRDFIRRGDNDATVFSCNVVGTDHN